MVRQLILAQRCTALLALTLITSAGCSTTTPAPGAPPPPQTSQPYPGSGTAESGPAPIIDAQTPPANRPKPQASATLALQSESQRAAAAGDLPKAIQILERAVRIQPDNAELWIDLARLHLKEGNPAQAEQLARKALLFTGQRYDLEQQAWVVIANALAQQK